VPPLEHLRSMLRKARSCCAGKHEIRWQRSVGVAGMKLVMPGRQGYGPRGIESAGGGRGEAAK
jgi:hypothetical protein